MLLDSNIIIYSFLPEHNYLQNLIDDNRVYCSEISYVETLGFHKLSLREKHYFERFFDSVELFPVSLNVIKTATDLRQQRKLSLGDAIVAASALEHRQTLITRNIQDFSWIEGLKLINPIQESE